MHRSFVSGLAAALPFLLVACGPPTLECPAGARLQDGACVAVGGTLRGEVELEGVTDGGHAGVQVALLGTDRIAISDAGGLWELSAVAPGSYTLQLSAEGYETVTVESVRVEDGRTTTLDPRVLPRPASPGAELVGVVRTEGGGAAEGALVYLEGTSHLALSDADGAFLLSNVEAGSGWLVVRLERHRTLRQAVVVPEQQTEVDLGTLELSLLEAPREPTGAVAGRVTLGGAPYPGVQVVLEGTGYAAWTDRDGRFLLDSVAAGEYVLQAAAPGWVTARVTGITVEIGSTTQVADLDLAPADDRAYGTVSGVARIFGGFDHSGTSVHLLGEVGEVASTVTDADGAWSLADVPQGLYRVELRAPPWRTHVVDNVVVSEGLYVVEDATLYLGEKVDHRFFSDALPAGPDRWVVWFGEGTAREAILFDGASGVQVPLPDDIDRPLVWDEVGGVVLSTRLRQSAKGRRRELLHYDPATGSLTTVLAGAATEAAPVDGPFAAGNVAFMFDASLRMMAVLPDGTVAAVTPPCNPVATQGWAPWALWNGWVEVEFNHDCQAWLDLALFHGPSGRSTGLVYQAWRTDLRDSERTLVLAYDPALADGYVLQQWEVGTGASSVIATGVHRVTRTVALHDVDPASGRGTVSALDPVAGTLTPLLTDAEPLQWDLVEQGPLGDLWQAPAEVGPGVAATKVCAGPQSHTVQSDWVHCRSGATAPYTLSAKPLDAPSGITVSTAAEEWHVQGQSVLWREGTSTWYAEHLPTGQRLLVCSGTVAAHRFGGSNLDRLVVLCQNGTNQYLKLADLGSGTMQWMLPGAGTLTSDSLDCTIDEPGVICEYQRPTIGTTAWDCGATSCVLAFSSQTGQSALAAGLRAERIVWSDDGSGVAVKRYVDVWHVRFGAAPGSVVLPFAAYPQGVGPGGRWALWVRSDATNVVTTPDGTVRPAGTGGAYRVGTGDRYVGQRHGIDLSDGTVTELSTTAIGEVESCEGGATFIADGKYSRWSAAGVEVLARDARRYAPHSPFYLVDLNAGVGTLMRRNPTDGSLSPIYTGVPESPVRVFWEWPLYVGRYGVGTGEDTGLMVLNAGTGEVTSVSRYVPADGRIWITGTADARFAFEARFGDKRILMGADAADPSADATFLGPEPEEVRWVADSGRWAYTAGGAWWAENMFPPGPAPVDVAEAWSSLALPRNDSGFLYVVDGVLWPELVRRGTWWAPSP